MTTRQSPLIVGVGGAGLNVLNRLISDNTTERSLLAINTDAAALTLCPVPHQLLIGERSLRGLGAGGNPSFAVRAAEESRAAIAAALTGAPLVILTAGMGGGTGTGASSEIAATAREAGAIVVAVVSRPFSFEGRRRALQAEAGLDALKDEADFIASFSNDAVLAVIQGRTTMQEAFVLADSVLLAVVEAMSGLVGAFGVEQVREALATSITSPQIAVDLFVNPRHRQAPRQPGLYSPSLRDGRTGLEPTM